MLRYILSILLFLILVPSCFNIFPEPHDLEFRSKEFNEIATAILNQKDVYEMDDFRRYQKSINGVAIKLGANDENQYGQILTIVEDSLRLNPETVSDLRKKLEDSKLREFIKSNDTILFIVDGFLDDSWGFMYSKKELKMDTTWFQFQHYTVKFVENTNSNWKRVAIY
jgi:hypothetical protein